MPRQFKYARLMGWQQFQLLTRDLLQKKYAIVIEEFGRLGQKQYGVDLIATIPAQEFWDPELELLNLDQDSVGGSLFIQCKHRTELDFDDILGDYSKLMELNDVRVEAFVVATSMERDATLQLEILRRRSEIPHYRKIFFWDDFEQMLSTYNDIAVSYGYYHGLSDGALSKIQGVVAGTVAEQLESFKKMFFEDYKKMAQESNELKKAVVDGLPMNENDANPKNNPHSLVETVDTGPLQELLKEYTKALFPRRFVDRFSPSRRERKFFLRKEYESFFRLFLNSCTLVMDEKSLGIDAAILEIVVIRALGLLATAHIKRLKKKGLSRIRFAFEMDPSKMDLGSEEREQDLRETFFEWAKNYMEFEEKPYDRDLLELDTEIPFENLFSYMKERFGYATIGMHRLVELTKLQTEMYKRLIQARDDDPALTWSILANFALESIMDIKSLKLPS